MSNLLPLGDPYAALEVSREAPQAEIAAAYARLSALLSGEELAAYGMLSPSELQAQREELDQAYGLINTPERRAAFDDRVAHRDTVAGGHQAQARISAHLQTQLQLQMQPTQAAGAAVRDEPVAAEQAPSPKTTSARWWPIGALGGSKAAAVDSQPAGEADRVGADGLATPSVVGEVSGENEQAAAAPSAMFAGQVRTHAARGARSLSVFGAYTSALSRELPDEAQFTGPLLRRLRESGGASLDDFSSHTKISRRYLKAIEAEDYSLLPAPAYVRGFVKEYAKLLGLEAKRVADSYLQKVPSARR